MKKLIAISFITLGLLGVSACDSNDNKESSSSDSGVSLANDSKAEFVTIAEKQIKETYMIDNFKIDMGSNKLKVFNSPAEKNAETGEEYKNIINGISEFTYQDKVYNFTLLYNKYDDGKYKIIYLYTPFDETKVIDTPLESEQ